MQKEVPQKEAPQKEVPQRIREEVEQFRQTVNSAPLKTQIEEYTADVVQLSRQYFKGDFAECISVVQSYHSSVAAFPCDKSIGVSVSKERIAKTGFDPAKGVVSIADDSNTAGNGHMLNILTDDMTYMFADIPNVMQIGSYVTSGDTSRFLWSDYCATKTNNIFKQLLSKLTEGQKSTFEYVLKPSVIMPTLKILDVVCGIAIRAFGFDSSIEVQVGHRVYDVYAFNRKDIEYSIRCLPQKVTDFCESLQENIETGKPINDQDAIKVRDQGSLGCNICYKDENSAKLKYCSRCRMVKYCSAECQKKDWRDHKKVCIPYAGK